MLLLLLPQPSALCFQLEAGGGAKEHLSLLCIYSLGSNQVQPEFNSAFFPGEKGMPKY